MTGGLKNCWELAFFRGSRGHSGHVTSHHSARGHQVLQSLNNVTTEEDGFQMRETPSSTATKCLETKYYVS